MTTRRDLRYVLILALLSLFFAILWFRGGKLFATAEEGMPFYNLEKSAYIFSSAWVRDGLGYIKPIFLPQFPLVFIANLFIPYFSNVAIQAFIFFFLILSGVIGFYYFSKCLTKDTQISFVAALFYFLNLYSMTQVWARALIGGMFTWAYYPIFVFIWIKALKEKKIRWLILLLITSLIYSYAYSYVASLMVLWTTAGIYVLVELIIRKWTRRERVIFLAKTLLFATLWGIMNCWWIYPYLTLSSEAFVQLNKIELNLESLKGVSKSFPIFEIIRLRQKFYFLSEHNKELPWGHFYESSFVHLTSWFGFALAVYGLIKAKGKEYWKFLTVLAIIGLFISKGTNPPLGFTFYKWLFTSIPFLSILRNSYEKFGLVFLLPYSLFFSYGFMHVIRFKFKKRTYGIIGAIVIFPLFFVYLVIPMWSGRVFQEYYFVQIPDHYKEINEYLNNDSEEFRILVTPIAPEHGLRYTWNYRGDDPSRYLFDNISISRNGNSWYSPEIHKRLYLSFEDNSIGLPKLLDDTNVKYIILNKDVDWEAIGSHSPDRVRRLLNNEEDIKFVGHFGNLELYKFDVEMEFSPIMLGGERLPDIKYERTGTNRFKVEIIGAEEVYDLVLKEEFNNRWKASISGEELPEHFKAFDYANAWEIDKTGDYTIDIVFKVWPWD